MGNPPKQVISRRPFPPDPLSMTMCFCSVHGDQTVPQNAYHRRTFIRSINSQLQFANVPPSFLAAYLLAIRRNLAMKHVVSGSIVVIFLFYPWPVQKSFFPLFPFRELESLPIFPWGGGPSSAIKPLVSSPLGLLCSIRFVVLLSWFLQLRHVPRL